VVGPFDWDLLLHYVRRGQVVPVVGAELSSVPAGRGAQRLETWLAGRLAETLDLADGPPPRDLQDARFHQALCGPRRCFNYSKLRTLLSDGTFPVPTSLARLASIRDFDLFVSTTFDGLLLDAVRAARGKGEAEPLDLAWSPSSPDADLPVDGLRGRRAVYRLFGRPSVSPEDYVVTEEDRLEFLHHLQAEHRRPQRLFDVLRSRHLLLVGCGFADWLARFFIRTVQDERLLRSPTIKTLVDDRVKQDRELVLFLSRFGAQAYEEADAVAFVEELARRWAALEAEEPARRSPADPEPGTIFISYAHEDRAAAVRLRDDLQAAGHRVWLDDRGIPDASRWEREIRIAIKQCALFVACLSRNTERRADQGAWFRREWKIACDEAPKFFGTTRRFLWQVVVDEKPLHPREIPDAWRELQRSHLPGGHATPPFLAEVEREVRRVRVDPVLQGA
jgi:TIR domain/SIR2-like domain